MASARSRLAPARSNRTVIATRWAWYRRPTAPRSSPAPPGAARTTAPRGLRSKWTGAWYSINPGPMTHRSAVPPIWAAATRTGSGLRARPLPRKQPASKAVRELASNLHKIEQFLWKMREEARRTTQPIDKALGDSSLSVDMRHHRSGPCNAKPGRRCCVRARPTTY
jgi:hypothetical protein